MNILLPTIGSAGDVHPMLELGLALQARGHTATVVTNPWFEKQARETGLGFIGMGTLEEAEAILSDERLWHPTKSFEFIAERAIIPNIERLYEIVREHRAANTIVAASGFCFGAQIAHEKLGVPLATVHLQPTMLRSNIGGGMQGRIYVGEGMPRVVKRALFWLLDKMVIDRVLGPPINAVRAGVGLAPAGRIMKSYVHSPQLVMGLFPEWFAKPQPDWPPNTHLAGFVLHDASEQFPVGAEVDEFLATGAPPVVFTPGSAASTMAAFFRESVEACRITGNRAMLVTNFPEQLPRELPANVRAFSYLPFGKILPRCAALVYPGGIGTMAQATKAGIPHLVVPHAHDQPDNALRVEKLGLGRRIYPDKYNAERAAGLLREIVGSAEIRRRCAEYAGRIDSRAALERACGLIEGLGCSD